MRRFLAVIGVLLWAFAGYANAQTNSCPKGPLLCRLAVAGNSGIASSALVSLDFIQQSYVLKGTSYSNVQSVPGWFYSGSVSGTGATVRTALNSAGQVIPFANGVPRITDLGLLIEESRTNSIWPSVPTNATWGAVLNSATLTDNAAVAPDGTTTAAALLETVATDAHYALTPNGSVNVANGSSVTVSTFVKPNGRTWAFVRTNNTIGNSGYYFNLSGAGSVGSAVVGTPSAGSISALGNGWYRVSVTVANSSGSAKAANLIVATATGDGVVSYAGDATKGLFVWGVQDELGAFPTSYIPTTGSAATRAADVASIALSVPAAGTSAATVLWPMAVVNSPRILGDTATFPALLNLSGSSVQMYNGSVVVSKALGSPTAGAVTKVASSWDASGRSVTGLGLIPATDANAVGTFSGLEIGSDHGQGSWFNGYIQRVVVYPARMSDAQLQALTQ